MRGPRRAIFSLAAALAATACTPQEHGTPTATTASAPPPQATTEVAPEVVAQYEEDLRTFEQQLNGCAELERLSATNPTVNVPPDCAPDHLVATCMKLRDTHAAQAAFRLPTACEPYLQGN